jgi:hypothetical protein
MQLQRLASGSGVGEGCRPGAGATPVLRTCRVGLRRAGRSLPRHHRFRACIWHGYPTYLRRIHAGSIQYR